MPASMASRKASLRHGAPSAKLRSARRWKRYWRPSLETATLSAAAGTTAPVESSSSRPRESRRSIAALTGSGGPSGSKSGMAWPTTQVTRTGGASFEPPPQETAVTARIRVRPASPNPRSPLPCWSLTSGSLVTGWNSGKTRRSPRDRCRVLFPRASVRDVSDLHRNRVSRLQRAIDSHAADFMLIAPSADFLWATGAHARSTERLLALVVPRSGDPFCLVPRLESDALAHECPWLECQPW